MRTIVRLLVLILLAGGALSFGGVAISLLAATSLSETLLFASLTSIGLGSLLLSGRKRSLEALDNGAYITGGGRTGDIRVWGRLTPGLLRKDERVTTSSGMGSNRRIEGAVPTWLTGEALGLALIGAGGIVLASVYLLGFG